ncbi:MAG: polysaccharide biosynthesis protein [Chloroflexi bacterium]|nr:polysaccharide biosynthesis protein [Chloroflexota bacterium]
MTTELRTTAPPPELLLGRAEFAGDLRQAVEALRSRRVLITGAAGSLGWPLSTLVAGSMPAALVLVDHHEHSLYSLERTLSSAGTYELADVRDTARMRRIFDQYRPEVVVHLAAAKHVPYGERFPEGTVAANVLATNVLLDLAATCAVDAFVYPSSDKSVRPPSVYGATKRIAEGLVAATAAHSRGRFGIVRFVNIIGTRGSVIENFSKWVQEDFPLRVTDERMTRYWISMNEALWCVLMAITCVRGGQVVMPACGEPVPLLQTARRLAGWYRPDKDPYPIECVGIRPGERLHEVLLSDNESFDEVNEPAAGLRRVQTRRDAVVLSDLPDLISELEALVADGARQKVAARCLEAAEALQ